MRHLYNGTFASLANDGSGIEFSTTSLTDIIEQINSNIIPVYANGDTLQPPAGRLMSAGWHGPANVGHAAVAVTVEFFAPLPAGGRLYVVPALIMRESVDGRAASGDPMFRILTRVTLTHAILTATPQDKTLDYLRPADSGTVIVKVAPEPKAELGPGTLVSAGPGLAEVLPPDQLKEALASRTIGTHQPELPMWVVYYDVPTPGESLRMSRNSVNVFAEDESHACRDFAAWADRFARSASIVRVVKADNGYQ